MLSFRLSDEFVSNYDNKEVPWGNTDAGGNSVGELTFIRTYSRLKDDGTKETWQEVCRRVIDGTYSIQKNHCKANKLPWNDRKAQASAQEAFDRMFHLKWTPPGRGLHQMGAPQVVAGNSASLQNCAVVGTGDIDMRNPGYVFQWGMEALMNGVGLGFDTLAAERDIPVHHPEGETSTFEVPDTREGWAESVGVLVNSYLRHGATPVDFDYSLIRPAGAPIKTFGGTASGPDPLEKIHRQIREVLERNVGTTLSSATIVDIFNLIGTCVVAGNTRRCLPGYSRVQTPTGFTNISDLEVGSLITTSGSDHPVLEKVSSGIQEVFRIKHRFGHVDATANHEVAVFTDLNKYIFKPVSELEVGDRLAWDSAGYEGASTTLPSSTYKGHFNASTYEIPTTLTADVAWLVGLIQGDGYVGSGPIEVTTANDEFETLVKARRVLEEEFSISSRIAPQTENAIRFRANSAGVSHWLGENVKRPKAPIVIPDWIFSAPREMRFAYLAGLFDADGRARADGVVEAVTTVHESLRDDVVTLLAGLGIATVVNEYAATSEWASSSKYWSVRIVGMTNRKRWSDRVAAHSVSGKFVEYAGGSSPVDFSYPYELSGGHGHQGRISTTTTLISKYNVEHGTALPTPVVSIESLGDMETFDIEVDDVHQFTVDGLIVHNSAEIALGSYGDEDFLELKNPEKFPQRNSYDPENPGWAWSSNNSINVPVGADYSQYIDRIVSNGEPGLIWLDVAKSMGRGKDGPDAKDRRIVGFNPCCLAADTSIMTSDGPKKISEIGGEFTAIVDGKSYPASAPWVSGVGDVYRLSTKEGFSIDLTPEHKIMKSNGEWVEAQSLRDGDEIRLNSHGSVEWGRTENFGEGYLLGHFVGDGNFSNQNKVATRDRGNVKAGMPVYVAHMKVWDIAGDDREVADYSQKVASEFATRSDWGGWSQVSDRPYSQMSITDLTYRYGIKLEDKHDIKHLEAESSEFYKGFLKGLFDADGHVEGYEEGPSNKGLSIRLGQSNRELLTVVQRMLLRLGINSKIYLARPAGESLLPDGKGGKAFYKTKASWRLIISADSAIRYAEIIGFLHTAKSEKLANALSWRKRVYTKPFVATVDSFEFLGRQEVWDAEVSTIHSFDANGLYAHNSEQPLESFEMCTLTTVHLQNHETKADLLRTLKFAFLYAKTVTLLPTPWPRTNAVMQRNRRIGLSLTGITDVLDDQGMPFLVDAMESGYDEVKRLDSIYSEWLCVRESNRVSTIKPEGCRVGSGLVTSKTGLYTLDELVGDEEWTDLAGLESLQGDKITKSYRNGSAETIRIKMRGGYEEIATRNHMWFTKPSVINGRVAFKGGWVRSDELKPGMVIESNVGGYVSETEAPLDPLVIDLAPQSRQSAFPSRMNHDLAWLIGYLWGDGSMSRQKHRLRFIDQNASHLEKAKRILEDQFGGPVPEVRNLEDKDASVLEVGSHGIFAWLQQNGIDKSLEARTDGQLPIIPRIIRESSRNSIIAFIAGLIDSDGCVGETSGVSKITVASSYEAFSKNFQEVSAAVGLPFGRSHNTKGKNLQKTKSIWLMTLPKNVDHTAHEILKKHSLKVSGAKTPFLHEVAARRSDYVFGRITSVESAGVRETFDVEVENSHWYYAGVFKSHNTVSILSGASPGIHWTPGGNYFLRAIRFADNDKMIPLFRAAGYKVEKDLVSANTQVVYFPIKSKAHRSEKDVTIFEKIGLAAKAQHHWSDNGVSVTVSFDQEKEADLISPALRLHEGALKAVSFLPMGGTYYPQMPYSEISEEEYNSYVGKIRKIDFGAIYTGADLSDAEIEKYCTTDACLI